jgi:phosphatidylglycerol lysyltransferase
MSSEISPAPVGNGMPLGGPRSEAQTHVLRIGLSLAVAAMGAIDLVSALLSHPPERLLALRHLVPTDVLDTSRTFTLLAGALLLVTAWGLRRGKRRAFVLAMFLCALSVPVNLLKAFDFEEATVASALLFALGVSADAFRVKSRRLSMAAVRSRTLGAIAALVVYAAVGSWVLETTYGHRVSPGRAFAEAWQRLTGTGEPVAIVPPELPHAQRRILEWYLRSLPVLSATVVLGLAIAALRPATYRRRHRAESGRVAELLRVHGTSSVCSFALADDADYFFSRNRRAVVAYRFESDTLLAIGDPIGPIEELQPLLTDFERHCRERDWSWGFFQARPELLDLYRSLGWRAIHIGEDPVLETDRFTLEGPERADVRRMAGRAVREGIEVRHFLPGSEALSGAGADLHEFREQLHQVSSEWLATRPSAEKGFCVGRFDPAGLRHGWLAVAWSAATRRVEGFVTWEPIWARRGWALDLLRRRSQTTPGTMELLIVRSVEHARARGDAMLSLSLSALANAESDEEAAAADEFARARAFLRRHLARFYDFEGLFRWKSKFGARFEDRYLVIPHPLALPRVTLALVRAQRPGGLLALLRAPRGSGPSPHSASVSQVAG